MEAKLKLLEERVGRTIARLHALSAERERLGRELEELREAGGRWLADEDVRRELNAVLRDLQESNEP